MSPLCNSTQGANPALALAQFIFLIASAMTFSTCAKQRIVKGQRAVPLKYHFFFFQSSQQPLSYRLSETPLLQPSPGPSVGDNVQ